MKKMWILPALLIFLLIIIYLLAGTPFVLNFAKNKIESLIQSEVGLPVHISSLKGNVLYKLSIHNFQINDVINIDNLSVSYNIFSLIFKKIDINFVVIEGLNIDLNQINSLTDNIKTKEQNDTPKTGKPFEINIKRIELTSSNFFGIINKQSIKFSLSLRGILTPQIFFIEHFYLNTKKSELSIKGDIPLNKDNHFATNYSLHLIIDEFGFEGLSGIIQVNGKLEGEYLNPTISSNGQFTLNYQNNQISGIMNLDWKVPFVDSLAINTNISVKTTNKKVWELTLKKRFTNLFFGIIMPYGEVRLPATMTGSVQAPKIKGQILGRLKYAQFESRFKGGITYQDSLLNIENIRIKDKDYSARIDAKLNIPKSEIINGNVAINCSNIGIINNFLETHLPITGILTINTRLSGKFDNPYIIGKVSLNNVVVDKERISQADFDFKLKNSVFYLDKGLINSPRGALSIDGTYNIKSNNFNGYIFSENIRLESPEVIDKDTIPLSGNIGLEIKLYGNASTVNSTGTIHLNNFVYDKWSFDDYTLLFNLNNNLIDISFSDSKKSLMLDASIKTDAPYHFNALLSLNHFEFGQYANLDHAYTTTRILMNGDISQIKMVEANIHIDSVYFLAQKNEIYNRKPMNIVIKNGIVCFNKSVIYVQNHCLLFEGQVPLIKDYGEINLKIQAEHIQIGSIYAMFGKEPSPVGLLNIDLAVKGNLTSPQIGGRLDVNNISYPIPGIVIDSVSGVIEFQQTYFNIKYFKGKINHGTFEVNGFTRLNESGIDTFAINLLFNKIDYKSSEFGSVILSGTLNFYAKNNLYNTKGAIVIEQATYDKPFNLQTIAKLLTTANRPVPEQNKILKQIHCDIGISSPNGIRIANNIANLNVNVDLQVRGYLSKINIYGTAKTASAGTIKYLGKKFEINNAIIQFDNPYKIDPVLNLEAHHYVSSRDGNYEIIMLLSGTIEKWYLQLSSIPSIPEQDIISLLLIGRRRPGMYLIAETKDIDLKGTARDYALGLAKGTLERTAEKSFGLEKFTITGDLLEPKRWDIGLEKRINKRLTFIYGTGIESWEMRRIGINYQINNNLSIFTLHDQENMNSSVDLELNFKIK